VERANCLSKFARYNDRAAVGTSDEDPRLVRWLVRWLVRSHPRGLPL